MCVLSSKCDQWATSKCDQCYWVTFKANARNMRFFNNAKNISYGQRNAFTSNIHKNNNNRTNLLNVRDNVRPASISTRFQKAHALPAAKNALANDKIIMFMMRFA